MSELSAFLKINAFAEEEVAEYVASNRFRDENGEPNGILYETARYLVNQLMPKETEYDLVGNLLDLDRIMLSQGVTTCTDMCEFTECDFEDVFGKAIERGFKNRVGYYYLWDYIRKEPEVYTLKKEKKYLMILN